MNLAEKLIRLRKEKGLSQLELAERMDVSRQAISRWETGAAVPSTENLLYLGELYGVSLEYLLYDNAPEPNRSESAPVESKNEEHNKKRKKIIALVLTIGILAAGFVYMVSLEKEREDTVPISEIEGSGVETNRTVEFDLEW